MQTISKYNEGIRFLLFSINIFSKYTRVVLTNDKKGIVFQKFLDESSHQPPKNMAR